MPTTHRPAALVLYSTVLALLTTSVLALLVPATPASAARNCPAGTFSLVATTATAGQRVVPAAACLSAAIKVSPSGDAVTVQGFTADDAARDVFCTIAQVRFANRLEVPVVGVTIPSSTTKTTNRNAGCSGNHQAFEISHKPGFTAKIGRGEMRVCVVDTRRPLATAACSAWAQILNR